jgi:hypothetical protein
VKSLFFLPIHQWNAIVAVLPMQCMISEGTDTVKVDFGAEIKCPKNPLNHFERLKWKDQWDIQQHYPQAYIQIQNLMMITGATSVGFCLL